MSSAIDASAQVPTLVPHEAPPRPSARPHLESLARNLDRAAERVREERHPDAIHDLRVAARRMGISLSMWGSELGSQRRRRMARVLRRTRRRLGAARELEVMTVQLEDLLARDRKQPGGGMGEWLLALAPEPADAILVPLVASLHRRVKRARQRAARIARKPRIRRLLARWTRGLDPLEPLSESSWEAAAARRHRLREEGLEALGRVRETTDDETLHRARIAVKKWRYALESWAEVTNETPVEVRVLRELQTHLGSVHDASRLREAMERQAKRAEGRERPSEAAAAALLQGRAEAERLAALEQARRAVAAFAPAPAPPV